MKFQHITILLLFATFLITDAHAQNNRISTQESIGWYSLFTTFKLTPQFGLHSEYQWRRADIIEDWQQSLLRVGVNYNPSPDVAFRLGYGWIETFPYGEIPINGLGRRFTEHRIFQMMQLNQKTGSLNLSHRFMLEQRFVGKYTSAESESQDEFPLLNRLRYMFRFQIPLSSDTAEKKSPYLAVYDEIFIGFGKHVNANVFDQNRIGILFGLPVNDKFRLEAGYLNQTVQFGRQIDGQNVFQYNNGLVLNAHFNVDFTRTKQE